MPGIGLEIIPGQVVAAGDITPLKALENPSFTVTILWEGTSERYSESPTDVALLHGTRPGDELRLLAEATRILSEPIKQGRTIVDFDYPMRYAGLDETAYSVGRAARAFLEGFRGEHGQGPTSTAAIEGRPGARGRADHRPTGGPPRDRWQSGGYAGAGDDAGVRSSESYAEASFTDASQVLMERAVLRTGRGGGIAIVDSGVDAHVVEGRVAEAIDLSQGMPTIVPGHRAQDPVGHGTRVARILNELLPFETRLTVVGLGAPRNVTASAVAVAMNCALDGVPGTPSSPPRSPPQVVSMSLWPAIEGGSRSLHQPLMIPFFASRRPDVAFVMAAGNYGRTIVQPADPPNLFYGVALDSRGLRASYSSTPSDRSRALCAFGGDDEHGFFAGRDATGTSWSTPLVAATLLDSMPTHPEVDMRHVLRGNFTRSAQGWWAPDWHVYGRIHG